MSRKYTRRRPGELGRNFEAGESGRSQSPGFVAYLKEANLPAIYLKEGTKLPDRIPNDHYPTPRGLVKAALEFLDIQNPSWRLPDYYQVDRVLDVGAGGGVWGQEAKSLFRPRSVTGVELRRIPAPAGFTDWVPGTDFLTWNANIRKHNGFDLIVSNPPYKYAEEIIRKSWDLLKPWGWMVFLLRLSFQMGVGRMNGLWKTHYPYKVGVSARRPSFYGGGNNGDDYAVYYWHKTGPEDRFYHNQDWPPFGQPQTWTAFLIDHEPDEKEDRPDLTDL